MRALIALLLLAAPAFAEAPSSTTATYGNWTLGCQNGACGIVTRLNLKGQDGQVRPLLSLGVDKNAQGLALRLELPGGVDLRAAPSVGVTGAAPWPLTWLTCDAGACLAGGPAGDDVMKALATVDGVEVTFTLFQGGKQVKVPVSLKGFGDAVKALKTAG